MKKRFRSLITAAAVCLSFVFTAVSSVGINTEFTADAASVDYPVQLMNIAVKDNSKVLTENGKDDGAVLSVKALGNNLAPSWRMDRVGADSKGTFFKITNAESGRLLTPKNYTVKSGTEVIMYGSESAQSQHWYAVPVEQDRLKNNLYYKIVNYSDTSLALTQAASGITLESYSGADTQKWLLNCDGLQGFAGYCKNDNTSKIKAGNIGGLFGETVEVSTFDELKKYAESDTPYTIIVKKNISVTDLNLNGNRYMCTAGRVYVRSNKTIVGSYGAHTLFNVQFCTSSGNGVGNNIIIRNFEMQHDAESNNNDSIQVYFGSGQNLWVDHVTFPGHQNYGYAPKTGQVDEDKFLACCYDADYCTVSDCSFGGHKYGLILGYPDSSESNYSKYDGYPRMTLAGNNFNDTNTRAPGLMRWGYYHSLNNNVNKFSMAYTVQANCRIFAENCYYSNGGNVICDWNLSSGEMAGSYAESGSKFSGCSRTVQGEGTANNPSYSKPCTWKPSANYDYIKLTADQAKTYCTSYSGCQASNANMMYLRFGAKGVPSAGFTTEPSGPMAPVPAVFANGSVYRIKNVNSGLYMQVAGGEAKNSANVQQWGSTGTDIHDIWKLIDAGDGYYYLVSAVGDGGTYVLDVYGKRTADGTNIDIYQYNGADNQKFMLTKNSDGSYKILTKSTNGASAVEVANAEKSSGANIQQYTVNGASCQDWTLEALQYEPGCVMDTSKTYEFENVNSGLVMDIADGKMEDGSNVQQWGSNSLDCQRWILKDFSENDNYYYIRSASDTSFVLKAMSGSDGGNIAIVPYSSKDSAMLFKFVKNLDGTYSIKTRASSEKCFVEVDGASKANGANVQQYKDTGSSCQDWNIKAFTTTSSTAATTAATVTTSTTVKTTAKTTVPSTTNVSVVTTTIDDDPTIPTEPDKIIIGDLNGDGKVSAADIVMIHKYLIKEQKFTFKQIKSADVNEDGIVNVIDSVIIKRMVIRI